MVNLFKKLNQITFNLKILGAEALTDYSGKNGIDYSRGSSSTNDHHHHHFIGIFM